MSQTDQNGILCGNQASCAFYWPSGTRFEFIGYNDDDHIKYQIVCEYLGDYHRCGGCSSGRPCGKQDWRCGNINNPDSPSGRKKVSVIIVSRLSG